MEHVVTLLVEREARTRVVEALREQATVSLCDTCSDFRVLLWRERPDAVIAEPRDRHGVSVAPLLQALRGVDPEVPMIAYLRPERDSTGDILGVVRAGITELVFHDGTQSRMALRSALRGAKAKCAQDRVLSLIRSECPVAMQPVMEYCVSHGDHRASVDEIAGALGVHRKTLADRLARADCPTPTATISWARLLVAAALLEDKRRTIDDVALELDYASPTAFRNQLKRYVGLTGSEMRRDGALTRALYALRSSLGDAGGTEVPAVADA